MSCLRALLIIIILACAVNGQKNPGVVIAMKPKLIDDIKMKFLPELIKVIQEQNLPDVHEKIDIPVLGNLNFDMTSMHLSIQGINPQEINLTLLPANRIRASIRGPTATISGNIDTKVKFIHVQGSVTATVRNINVDVEVSIGRIANKDRPEKMGPFVKIESIEFIGNLDISVKVSGSSASDILNLIAKGFIKFFNDLTKSTLIFT